MTSYVSARFEKTDLPLTGQTRIIVRNLDQGPVPPQPSGTYYPTHPDDLQTFIVAEFVSRATGENYVRVATLSDLVDEVILTLNTLEDTAADFAAAGVVAGDALHLTLSSPTLWTSEEYPGTNPFIFTVESVVSATQLTITEQFPAFHSALTWEIPDRSIAGTAGVTIRSGNPANSSIFLERRFNKYFNSAVAATRFVTATKADLVGLANAKIDSDLGSESFTAEPTS